MHIYIKGMTVKKANLSNTSKTSTSLIDKVIERIDLDELSNSLADRLASRLVDSIKFENLVETLFDKYSETLQNQLSDAIIQKL